MKVTPKMVSGRVVKTSIVIGSWVLEAGRTLKETIAPTDFPIQLRCDSLIDSLQSISFKPCNKRSA